MKPAAMKRLQRLAGFLAKAEKEGVTHRVLSVSSYHYRLTGPRGVEVDFWPTTDKWMKVGADRSRIGRDEMLKFLIKEDFNPGAPDVTTIFTDASFCHDTLAAGWAAWCRYGQGRGKMISGQLKGKPLNAELAEAMAIANGLYAARKNGIVRPENTVIIESDCLLALCKILGYVDGVRADPATDTIAVVPQLLPVPGSRGSMKKMAALSAQYMEVMNSIAILVRTYRLSIVLRHVKGHTGKNDPRSNINRMCDVEARANMRAWRNQMRSEEAQCA